ncbi:hypothetical protein D5125_17235 [Magnetovirga frankeli]|uniref:hypothetical protein n=1 Tax=Magnetovirga frankeli TaxID=947516 RepID=UPI001AF4DB95|nr:hypothetical protein D5125_17235 [gamma proteobacterium SS-5]
MPSIKAIILISALLPLSACQTSPSRDQWQPLKKAAHFEQAHAECELRAMGVQQGYYASGTSGPDAGGKPCI